MGKKLTEAEQHEITLKYSEQTAEKYENVRQNFLKRKDDYLADHNAEHLDKKGGISFFKDLENEICFLEGAQHIKTFANNSEEKNIYFDVFHIDEERYSHDPDYFPGFEIKRENKKTTIICDEHLEHQKELTNRLDAFYNKMEKDINLLNNIKNKKYDEILFNAGKKINKEMKYEEAKRKVNAEKGGE